MAVVFFFVAGFVYGILRCCTSKSYIQSEIDSECRKKMEKAVTDAFVAAIVQNVCWLLAY